MTFIIGEIVTVVMSFINIALHKTVDYFQWFLSLLTSNFKFDKPFHIWSLAGIFLISIVGFLSLFGGGGRIGDYSNNMIIGDQPTDFALGGEWNDPLGEGFLTTSLCVNDLDCDGIVDEVDSDKDGDSIPDADDSNIDGDSLENDFDTSPCGDRVPESECIANRSWCGNKFCDTFTLNMRFRAMGSEYWYYEIPASCLKYGTKLTEIENVDTGEIEYGIYTTQIFRNSMSDFCRFGQGITDIEYFETKETCPEDCGGLPTIECSTHSECAETPDYQWQFCCPVDQVGGCSNYCVSDACVTCVLETYPCTEPWAINGTCSQCIPGTQDYTACYSTCQAGNCVKSSITAYLIAPFNEVIIGDEYIYFDWY